MTVPNSKSGYKLSIVIPCFNEENTLKACVERVMDIKEPSLSLEIIIVDDCSTDNSYKIAKKLEKSYSQIRVVQHDKNQGKGKALNSGFKLATGDFVAVQDADLEYDPFDLKRLIQPLIKNHADVVFGSRFLSYGSHRVLYFWHYIGNRILTFVSNMFTDLNLTDMETCYKVFRREVIQRIKIEEKRFGVEPEIVAKVAHMRLRIYEMGISYHGRTYAEGKKIGFKDGIRALYCILHYNAHKLPVPIQMVIYFFIGLISAVVNYCIFIILYNLTHNVNMAAAIAFILAAVVNYFLCIAFLFRHKARWNSFSEIVIYFIVVSVICLFDVGMTRLFFNMHFSPSLSKIYATIISFILNFLGRRFLVFSEPSSGPWTK